MGLSRETEGEDRTTRPAATTLVAGFSNRVECQFHVPSFTFFSLSRALFLTLHVSTFRSSSLGGETISDFLQQSSNRFTAYSYLFISFLLDSIISSFISKRCLSIFFFRIKEFCVFTKFIRHPWRLIIDYRIFLNWSRQNERMFSKWN